MILTDTEILEHLNKLDRDPADERCLVLVTRGFAQNGDGEKTDNELIEGCGL